MASKLPCLLDTASKFVLFSVSGLKEEKLITVWFTLTETETEYVLTEKFWFR